MEAGWILLANNLGFLMRFAQGVVIARYLGPSGKGAYALVFLFPGIAAVVGELGLGNATVYYLARAGTRCASVFRMSLLSSFLVGLLLWVGVIAATPLLIVTYRDLDGGLVKVGGVMALTSVVGGVCRQALMGMRRPRLFSLSQILGSASSLFLVTTALGVCGKTVSIAVYASALSALLSVGVAGGMAIFAWLNFSPEVYCSGENGSRLVWTPPLRGFVGYGLRTHAVRVAQFLNYRLDQVIIPIYLGDAALGLYTVAVAMAERLWDIAAALQTVLMPRMSAETRGEGAERVAVNLPAAMIVTVVAGAGLVAVGHPMINIVFGKAFNSSYGPMVLLVLAGIPIVLWKVIGSFFVANDEVNPLIGLSVVALVCNLVGNMLLAPRFGLNGVAVASLVSYSITGFGVALLFQRRTGGLLGRVKLWWRRNGSN